MDLNVGPRASNLRWLAIAAGMAVLLSPGRAGAIPAPDILGVVGGMALAPLLLVLPLLLLPLRWLLARSGLLAVRPGVLLLAVIPLAFEVPSLVRTWDVHVVPPAAELRALLRDGAPPGERPIIVDLRMPHSYHAWHVRGALRGTDYAEAERVLRQTASQRPGVPIIVYCYIGTQSAELAATVAIAARDGVKPFAGRSVAVISGGAGAVHAGVYGDSMRVVRAAPRWLAKMWVELGDYELVKLGDDVAEASLLDRLAQRQRPVALDLGSSHAMERVDEALSAVPAAALLYVLPDEDFAGSGRWSLPTPPMAAITAALRPLTGGGWGTVGLLLAVELAVILALRGWALRRAMVARRGMLSWLFLLVPTVFTVLVAQIAAADPRFFGIDFTAQPLPGWTPLATFALEVAVLTVGLTLALGNPTDARLARMIQGIRRFAEPPPAVVHLGGPWLPTAVATFVLLVMAVGSANLPALVAASLGVYAPLLLDVVLARGLAARLRRHPTPSRALLGWAGVSLSRTDRGGEVAWTLETRFDGRPACFALYAAGRALRAVARPNGRGEDVARAPVASPIAYDLGDASRSAKASTVAASHAVAVGAFSGKPVAGSVDLDPAVLGAMVATARRLRVVTGGDVSVDFTAAGAVCDVRGVRTPLADNHPHETVMQSARGVAPRFAGGGYDEVARAPTPLTLDVLRARWSPRGAAVRALAFFGVRVRPAAAGDHSLWPLGDAIYKDLAVEAELFAAHRWARPLRAYLLRRYAAFTLDHAAVLGGGIEPAARRRIARWRRADMTGSSERRAVATVSTALRALAGPVATWQEKISLAHRECYEALEDEARRQGRSFAGVIAGDLEGGLEAVFEGRTGAAGDEARTSYELRRAARHIVRRTGVASSTGAALATWLERWRRAERLRQTVRALYLDELEAVAALVARLDERFAFGGALAFLHVAEIPSLRSARWRPRLQAIAAARRAVWSTSRGIVLPDTLTAADLERLELRDRDHDQAENHTPGTRIQGVRVAGPPAEFPVRGIARVVPELRAAPALGPHEILVTHRVEPRWMPSLRGARGLVTETGGVLSHAAILARELGLPAVMGARGAIRAVGDGMGLWLTADGGVEVEGDAHAAAGSELWLPLWRAAADPSAGIKARRLGIMAREGLRVPSGAVLGYECLRLSCQRWGVEPPRYGDPAGEVPEGLRTADVPSAVARALDAIVASLDAPRAGWIVRSAAAAEDDAGRSFAGLFESVAAVQGPEELRGAVCRCWAAAWSEPVRAYGGDTLRGEPVRLDLIVQHFVPASVGGVLFTVDPMTRDASSFVVEAARGGPRTVVAGGTPDLRLRVPRDGGEPEASGATELLARGDVDRLRRLGLRLEELFAAHQDVEWLLCNGELHVLQARDAV